MKNIRINEVLTLKREATFQYPNEPREVTWTEGSQFKVDGFETLMCEERILIGIKDKDGRIFHLMDNVAEHFFSREQLTLFE